MREYAIELFFDAVTETMIHSMWDALERHTNAKTPLQRQSRPHLSLVSGTIDQLEILNPYLQLIARQYAPFEIQFTGLGFFCSTQIVFLMPTVNQSLLTLHQHIFNLINQNHHSISPYEHPNIWHPHCTLSQSNHLFNVELFNFISFPIHTQVMSIGIVEILPDTVKPYSILPLQGI